MDIHDHGDSSLFLFKYHEEHMTESENIRNPEKIIIEEKLKDFSDPEPEVEYVVDGSTIGMEAGPIPCIVDVEGGDTCEITIADGPHTGEKMAVPARHVTALGKEFFEAASGKLFK